MSYYIEKIVSLPLTEAEHKMRTLLKEVGFGIITEIDMQKTLQEKIGKSIKPYKILGACNPTFAYEALQEEEKIGILLPCNVTLQATDDTHTSVAVMDPVAALSIVNNNRVSSFAETVRERLTEALEKL